MQIKTTIDVSLALQVSAAVLRKVPFAINTALTETGKQAVDAGKKEITKDFELRKSFVRDRIQVLEYSKPNRLSVTVGINSNVQGSPLLLGFFEEGGEKKPTRGGLAIPITGGPARPDFSDPVRPAWRYTNLKLDALKASARATRGKGTYIVPDVGVFRRVAPGRGGGELVYLFEHSVELHKRTHLIETFRGVLALNFTKNFNTAFVKELGGRKGEVKP